MTRLQGFITLQKGDKTPSEGFYGLPEGLYGTISRVCSGMRGVLWLTCRGYMTQ